MREITATHLLRPDVSPVFHGRDVFAPVAAHLAAGMAFEELRARRGRPRPASASPALDVYRTEPSRGESFTWTASGTW